MKFCKNLQKIVVVSDPDWVPYWTNYKMLKKLIKQIPSDEDSDDDAAATTASVTDNLKTQKKSVRAQQRRQPPVTTTTTKTTTLSPESQRQQSLRSSTMATHERASASSSARCRGIICRKRKPLIPNSSTKTSLSALEHDQPSGGMIRSRGAVWFGSSSSSSAVKTKHDGKDDVDNTATTQHPSRPPTVSSTNTQSPCSSSSPLSPSTPLPSSMKSNPGEVSFFRLLHSEVRKVSYFFSSTTSEFALREKKVRDGLAIAKHQDPPFVISDGWSLMAKSIYRLYMDLSSLEMFAIVAYCSFSKILKKHDKVTGRQTRSAFMTNVVNEAPFMNYPKILDMMKTCAVLYEEVAQRISSSSSTATSDPGSSSKVLEGLHDDERLFIGMIHRFNEEVMESAGMEKPPPTFYSMRDPTTPHEIRSLIEMTLTSSGSDDDHLRRRVSSFRLYDRDRGDAASRPSVEDHCDAEDEQQQQQQQQQRQRQQRQSKRSRM